MSFGRHFVVVELHFVLSYYVRARFQVLTDLDLKVLFLIQNQKINREPLIETGRNRSVSRNQTAILAGTLNSRLTQREFQR